MNGSEGAPQHYEHYQPADKLLGKLDSRLKIAPWDMLDLDLPGGVTYRHLPSAQILPLEQVLREATNYSAPNNRDLYPFDNYKRGMLNGVDAHCGTIELSDTTEVLLLQYVHNPREGFDSEGNPSVYNDGIANVFLEPKGGIHSCAMLPNGDYRWFSFSLSPNRSGIKYPENTPDAVNKIRQASGPIDPNFLPLLGKVGRLVNSATDIWFDRETEPKGSAEQLLKIPGDIKRYTITRDRTDAELAQKIGAPLDEHPLSGLIDQNLLPERFDIVEVEGYKEMVYAMAENGFRFPTFFRSSEMGIYFSSTSRFEDEVSANGIREILGYNDIADLERGLIMPAFWPEGYEGEWNTPLAYIKHQMLLQVYEDLPDEVRSEMLRQCSEIIEHSVDLRNHASISTDIPDLDTSSPYAFRQYSRVQQEKILGAFIAGSLSLNSDFFPYWAGPHLHGDGTKRGDWIPSGVPELLEDTGFYISRAPKSKVHELFVRGVEKNGDADKSMSPYADSALSIDNSVVYRNTPVNISEIELLEGFSLKEPNKRLQKDLEDGFGFAISFPEDREAVGSDIVEITSLREGLQGSALRLIAQALEKYPPTYVQDLGIEHLIIVESMVNTDSYDTKGQEVLGMTAYDDKTIYFSYHPIHENVLHHEIRHFADKTFGRSEEESDERSHLAGALFTHPQKLFEATTKDPVLKTKLNTLFQILEEESHGIMDDEWRERVLHNPRPFSNPVIFAQTLSHGYLTHSSEYLDAIERKARKMGSRDTYKR